MILILQHQYCLYLKINDYVNYIVCNQDGISVNVTANQREYTIDVSQLTGEYYVGVASSNREMYLYDLYLTD